MVDTPSKNYLTIALEEVAQGKINSRYRVSSDVRPARRPTVDEVADGTDTCLVLTGGISAPTRRSS